MINLSLHNLMIYLMQVCTYLQDKLYKVIFNNYKISK